jgi:hypothetical protein
MPNEGFATGPLRNQLNIEDIKAILDMLYNNIQNLQTAAQNPQPQLRLPTHNNPNLMDEQIKHIQHKNCLLPTPPPYDPYWYRHTKPPEITNYGTHTTAGQPPIVSLLPQQLPTYRPTYTVNLNPPLPISYAEMARTNTHTFNRQRRPIQHRHIPPPTNKQPTRKPDKAHIYKPVPDDAFQIFRLIRSYANNRHSYRLFLNDLEEDEKGSSNQMQKIKHIQEMIMGQRLMQDNALNAVDLKQHIFGNLTVIFNKMNSYYENNFLLQDHNLMNEIQSLLKPLTLSQIQTIHEPILIHTLKSIDKRRLGRNYRHNISTDISDILFHRPARLKTTCEIFRGMHCPTEMEIHKEREDTECNPTPDKNEHLPPPPSTQMENIPINLDNETETITPATSTHNSNTSLHTNSHNSTLSRISSTNSHTNTLIVTPSKATSINSSVASIFSPDKWTEENISSTPQPIFVPRRITQQDQHIHNIILTPITNFSRTQSEPNLHNIIEPADIIPSSQAETPMIHNISSDTEVRSCIDSQPSSSTYSKEDKIQPMKSAITNLKHHTTNIHDFTMPSPPPLPCCNPFRFRCKDDFARSLTDHLNIHTNGIETTIIISVVCNGNTPIDNIPTHIILQPTPPSLFFTNASKLNTFFNCLRNLNKHIILEFIFTHNPPANILWHHLYRHCKNKFPIIISTTPEILPFINTSHRSINTSSGHDASLLLLYNTIRHPNFLKTNNHFLSREEADTSGV